MAKRGRKKASVKTRTVYKTRKVATRRRRGVRKAATSLFGQGLYAMGYGAVRARISNTLRPYIAKIPFVGNLAQLSDEAALGGLAYWGAKKLKNKTAKKFCETAFIVENASVGSQLSTLGANSIAPGKTNGVYK